MNISYDRTVWDCIRGLKIDTPEIIKADLEKRYGLKIDTPKVIKECLEKECVSENKDTQSILNDRYQLALECVHRRGNLCKLTDIHWNELIKIDTDGKEYVTRKYDIMFNFRDAETGKEILEFPLNTGETIVAPRYLCTLHADFYYQTNVPKFDRDVIFDAYILPSHLRMSIAKQQIKY